MLVEKHYGPGRHPKEGTPQSVHGRERGVSGLTDRLAESVTQTGEGGFTYRLFSDSSPTTGKVVSPFPEREQAIDWDDWIQDPRGHVRRYIRKNSTLLKRRGHFLGGWFDPQTKRVVLDTVIVTRKASKAHALAMEHNQDAYFDLDTGETVRVRKSEETEEKQIGIKKVDEELRIVWGEVYVPWVPDSQGDFMTPAEVRKMAHRFLLDGRTGKVDLQHDNRVNYGSAVVESFITREDDPLFVPDSWVVGVWIPNDQVWEAVKAGELNGFSIEARVLAKEAEIELDVPEEIQGKTATSHGHSHAFTVRFDEEGRFQGGETDTVDGHSHKIVRGTVTEAADGHSHRYSFLEQIRSTT